jgi:hypothetical protein
MQSYIRKSLDKTEVDTILGKLKMWTKYPSVMDSDTALVNVYIKAYHEGGKEYAQKEVGRRIRMAKEIKKLKEYVDIN